MSNVLLEKVAAAALLAGVSPDDGPNGSLATWIRANVRYRPESEFDVLFLTSCEMERQLRSARLVAK